MAVDSNDLYTACTLSLDAKTIRVLHMKPGDESDQIQGSLRYLELDTEPPPQYECVWYGRGILNLSDQQPSTSNMLYFKRTSMMRFAISGPKLRR